MQKDIEYPSALLKDRSKLEAIFVFGLWNRPEGYGEYLIDWRKFFINNDAKFYYRLGYYLYKKEYTIFDEPTIDLALSKSALWKEKYDELGGYETVKDLMACSNCENTPAIYTELVKNNMLLELYNNPKLDVLDNLEEFETMTPSDLQDYFENTVENIFIQSNTDIHLESLLISDEELKDIFAGNQMGLPYEDNCPRLNYITMGIPKGELTMLAGYSGVGKTSFVFGNIIMPLTNKGIKCAIISNEQRSIDFKNLLIVYVLQKFFKVYNITRKHLKNGKLNEEQKEQILEAKKYIAEHYTDIKFVKLFDNNMTKVKKIIRSLANDGYEAFMFDTMKSEDATNDAMWQQLLQQSRELFQLASKYNIAIIATYQLALHTLNRRFLNAMCLSNAKQIKEVFSEMVYLREIWEDEFDGEKFNIHPYDFGKINGKYERTEIEKPLIRGERYLIAFVDKTRNDEGRKQLVYKFNGAFNSWEEIGYCKVYNDHK